MVGNDELGLLRWKKPHWDIKGKAEDGKIEEVGAFISGLAPFHGKGG